MYLTTVDESNMSFGVCMKINLAHKFKNKKISDEVINQIKHFTGAFDFKSIEII